VTHSPDDVSSFFSLSFFFTALSAQQQCHSLVESHHTMHQDTWILLLAQLLADTDLQQVSSPDFVHFLHSGPGWSLLLLMRCPALYVTQPLCNTLRQPVNMQEEQYYTHYKQRGMPIQAQGQEFVPPSQAAAAAIQQLESPLRCCASHPQLGQVINSPAAFWPNYSIITLEQVEKELGGKDTV